LGAIAAIAALSALAPGVAAAGTITPTDGVDEYGTIPGHCSLREAIQAAQTAGSFNGCTISGGDSNADTIQLIPATTYTLSLTGGNEDANATGDLDIVGQAGTDDQLGITTTAAGRATIDANGLDRAFDVGPGLYPIAYMSSFGLANVEIKGGAGVSDGGAVKVADATFFSLANSYIHDNAADAAGAIHVPVNTVIADSRIEGNTADAFGGIWTEGDLTISGTTVAGNHALNGPGGGIGIGSPFVDVSLTNSTVTGNDASTDGGGIYSQADPANPPPTGPGSLTIASSTVAGNHADADSNGSGNGGGIFMQGTASSTTRNSIFGDNTDFGGQAPDCSGSLTSQGYNLFESILGCTVTLNNDVIGDPKLGPAFIDPVGVPVPVLPLLPGSPAINAANPGPADNSPPHCPTADQRADSRGSAFVDGCDIGAFEYQAHDTDSDQYPDDADNCPNVLNPTQANAKGGTAAGDACEDQDSDGVLDAADNCATQAGPASNAGCPLPVQTGQRAAALKKCKKKKKAAARKKCKKKALKLPV
jgi:hypothetical protein